jgi:hypothetical protein
MAILLEELDDELTDELGHGLADENDEAMAPFMIAREGMYVAGAAEAEAAGAGAKVVTIFTPGAAAAQVS